MNEQKKSINWNTVTCIAACILGTLGLAASIFIMFLHINGPVKGKDLDGIELTKYALIARPDVLNHPFCKQRRAIAYEGEFMSRTTVKMTVRCEDKPVFTLLYNTGLRF
ncbi:hypothetical protein [Neptuniibacter sp. QD37_11]|uniref:hypothetical protein n=1 Tax=Neptuniibacter sp. QD37_11 TaxID=3398209 RepID=UPI0039F50321